MRLAVSTQNSVEMHEREMKMETAAISIHCGHLTLWSSLNKHSVKQRRTKSKKQVVLSTSITCVFITEFFFLIHIGKVVKLVRSIENKQATKQGKLLKYLN